MKVVGDRRPPLGAVFSLLTVIAIFAGSVEANAHSRSQSYSTWRIDGTRVDVVFTIGAREVTRLSSNEGEGGDLGQLLQRHLASRLAVTLEDGTPCIVSTGPTTLNTRSGYVGLEWTFDCEGAEAIQLQNAGFFDVAMGHVNFARIDINGQSLTEVMFAVDTRSHTVDLTDGGSVTSGSATFSSYLVLGIKHILVGIDHIAFLIALLLLAGRPRDVILIVTGFTVGHSLTLSLAALGIVEPNVPIVESLIGFTIALVALENVGASTGLTQRLGVWAAVALAIFAMGAGFGGIGPPWFTLLGLALFTYCYLALIDSTKQTIKLRPVITVLFGLIHGFGFASVLSEIGLPTGKLILALLGFNLGVEFGQIMVVILLAVASYGAARLLPRKNKSQLVDVMSAILFGLGLYWFVGRALQIV